MQTRLLSWVHYVRVLVEFRFGVGGVGLCVHSRAQISGFRSDKPISIAEHQFPSTWPGRTQNPAYSPTSPVWPG